MSIDNIGDQVSVLNDTSVSGDVKELLKSKFLNGRDEKSGKLFGQYHLPDYRNRVQEVGIVDTNELKEKVPEVYEELVDATVRSFTRLQPEDIVKDVMAKDMKENPEYYSDEYKQTILNKTFASLAIEGRKQDGVISDWKENIWNIRKIMEMSGREREMAIDYVFSAFSAEEDANGYKLHIHKVPDLVSTLVDGSKDPIFDKAKDYIESRKKVYEGGDSVRKNSVRYAEYAQEALGILRNNTAEVYKKHGKE